MTTLVSVCAGWLRCVSPGATELLRRANASECAAGTGCDLFHIFLPAPARGIPTRIIAPRLFLSLLDSQRSFQYWVLPADWRHSALGYFSPDEYERRWDNPNKGCRLIIRCPPNRGNITRKVGS